MPNKLCRISGGHVAYGSDEAARCWRDTSCLATWGRRSKRERTGQRSSAAHPARDRNARPHRRQGGDRVRRSAVWCAGRWSIGGRGVPAWVRRGRGGERAAERVPPAVPCGRRRSEHGGPRQASPRSMAVLGHRGRPGGRVARPGRGEVAARSPSAARTTAGHGRDRCGGCAPGGIQQIATAARVLATPRGTRLCRARTSGTSRPGSCGGVRSGHPRGDDRRFCHAAQWQRRIVARAEDADGPGDRNAARSPGCAGRGRRALRGVDQRRRPCRRRPGQGALAGGLRHLGWRAGILPESSQALALGGGVGARREGGSRRPGAERRQGTAAIRSILRTEARRR